MCWSNCSRLCDEQSIPFRKVRSEDARSHDMSLQKVRPKPYSRYSRYSGSKFNDLNKSYDSYCHAFRLGLGTIETTANSNRFNRSGIKSLQKPEEYECQVEQLEAEAKDRLDQLSMFNSSWMINASLLGQSPVEGGPYCASGRVILMAWWFFMMILSAMYTANLAAFLTGRIQRL